MLSGAHRAKCCMRKNVYKYFNIHMPVLKASIKWNSTILKYLETLSKFQFQIHRFAVKAPKNDASFSISFTALRHFQHSTCKFRAGRVGTWSLVILCHVWKWSIWIGGFQCTHSIHWGNWYTMYTYMKTLNLNICSELIPSIFWSLKNSMKNSPAGHVPVDSPGFEPNQLPMTHVLQAMHDLKSCKMTTRWGETADGFRNLAKTSWGW